MLSEITTSALYFDGDFKIENKDLKVVKGSLEARRQALVDYLKSQYNDYVFYPSMCANLEVFIGRGIDASIKQEFHEYVERAIIASQLFSAQEFQVYTVVQDNSILLRIILLEQDESFIQMNLTTTTGVTIE